MPRKTFVAGEILTASDVNEYLSDQAVMTFADAAARDAAIPTPSEGMVAYLEDANLFTANDGSAWKTVLATTGGVLQVVSTTVSTATSGSVAGGGVLDVPGMTATITPKSASNRVLVFASITGSAALPSVFGYASFRIERTTTPILAGDAAGSRARISAMNIGENSTSNQSNATMFGSDSPNTTSAVTYKLVWYNLSGDSATIYLNRTTSDSDASTNSRAASTLMLMEVAG